MKRVSTLRVVIMASLALSACEEGAPIFGEAETADVLVNNATDTTVIVTYNREDPDDDVLRDVVPADGFGSTSSCVQTVEGRLEDGTVLFPPVPIVCDDGDTNLFDGNLDWGGGIYCRSPYFVSRVVNPDDPVPCELDVDAIPDWPDRLFFDRPRNPYEDLPDDPDGNSWVLRNRTDHDIDITWLVDNRTATLAAGEILRDPCPVGFVALTADGHVLAEHHALVCEPNRHLSERLFGVEQVEYAVVCDWPYILLEQQATDWPPPRCTLEPSRLRMIDTEDE